MQQEITILDLPDNGVHVGAHADPSNDLVGLTLGAGAEVLIECFKDIFPIFHLFQTALEALGICLSV